MVDHMLPGWKNMTHPVTFASNKVAMYAAAEIAVIRGEFLFAC
jgi:hypothetical protein